MKKLFLILILFLPSLILGDDLTPSEKEGLKEILRMLSVKFSHFGSQVILKTSMNVDIDQVKQ